LSGVPSDVSVVVKELDEAARRRLTRRLYVPLPDEPARRGLIVRALTKVAHNMEEGDIGKVVEVTAGYSGADVAQVCTVGLDACVQGV
jgi:SpoVK/Ycf46/Vps4 family AAA+-type ATPase